MMVLNFLVFLVLINRLSVALSTMPLYQVRAINTDLSIQNFNVYKNKCVFAAKIDHEDLIFLRNPTRFLNFLYEKYHKDGLEVVVFDDYEYKYIKPFYLKFDLYIGDSYRRVKKALSYIGNNVDDNRMYLLEKNGKNADIFQIRNGIMFESEEKCLLRQLFESRKRLYNNNPNQEKEDKELIERLDRRIKRCLSLKNN